MEEYDYIMPAPCGKIHQLSFWKANSNQFRTTSEKKCELGFPYLQEDPVSAKDSIYFGFSYESTTKLHETTIVVKANLPHAVSMKKKLRDASFLLSWMITCTNYQLDPICLLHSSTVVLFKTNICHRIINTAKKIVWKNISMHTVQNPQIFFIRCWQ